MNNKTGFNRLNRRAGHRRAMIKNMVTSLFTYERITTTKSKALEVKRHAEKMVTRAKVDSVHNRREIAKTRNFGKKSLEEIKLKLKDRNLTFGMTDTSQIIQALKLTKQDKE